MLLSDYRKYEDKIQNDHALCRYDENFVYAAPHDNNTPPSMTREQYNEVVKMVGRRMENEA